MSFKATVDDAQCTMDAGHQVDTIAHMSTLCSGELKIDPKKCKKL